MRPSSTPLRAKLDAPRPYRDSASEELFVPDSTPPPLPFVGADVRVPLVSGYEVRHVNLDVASGAPCFVAARDAVEAFLARRGSAPSGAGSPCVVTRATLDDAARAVARFVGARPDDRVHFTAGASDAITRLARALPDDVVVVRFRSEHEANLDPWRRFRAGIELPVPRSPGTMIHVVDRALASARGSRCLLAVTGASHVTGELVPVDALAEVARRHGARILVDAAHLAPHRPLAIARSGIDWVAFSGRKLYAPLGAGALVGRGDWLDEAPPCAPGGQPNVPGVVALAAACEAIARVGFGAIAAHEARLLARLEDGLGRVDGVRRVAMFTPDGEAVGAVSFTVRERHAGVLAAALAAEHGVSVSHGAFRAPVLVRTLLGGDDDADVDDCGGALRVSFGAATSVADVERFILALDAIVQHGPRARYVTKDGCARLASDSSRPPADAPPSARPGSLVA